ncbi:O-antigen ligase family protein [Planctomycetota bacterium]
MFTAFWSPMKAVSLGHAGEMFLYFLLAAMAGMTVHDERSISKIFKAISLLFLAISIFLILLYYLSPTYGNLSRPSGAPTTTGIVHPTAVGHMTSFGLVLFFASYFLWKWRWTRTWMLPVAILEGWLMVLASSRISIFLTIVFLLFMIVSFGSRKALAFSILIMCILGTVYLCTDASTTLTQNAYEGTETFLLRGQAKDQLRNLNGRTELWSLVWAEFCESPVQGHGYFVTSSTGRHFVWGAERDITAHNLLLQALVSTGIIGTCLLLWGGVRILIPAGIAFKGEKKQRRLAVLTLIVGIFICMYGLLDSSFLGPVTPASPLIFVVLGIAARHL